MRRRLTTLFVAFVIASSLASPRTNADPKPKVKLLLTAVRPVWSTGGLPARVRIEFENEGEYDFIIGENLLPIVNASTYVIVDVMDSAGHLQPSTVMDIETSFEARNASWTRIAPGHFYGIEFDLVTKDYPALSRPGRYKVTAKYISKGGNTPASPEWDVPSDKVWEGEITSNSVTIEVKGQKKRE